MKRTKKPQQDAYQLAREIIGDHLDISQIEWLVSEHITSDPRQKKLLTRLYPAYRGVDKQLAKIGGEVEELHLTEVNAYKVAYFALGFAAAMKFATGKS